MSSGSGLGIPTSDLRVLLVADNVSARFGGEAFLPLNYYTFLRARGIDTHLVTHERVRDELLGMYPGDHDRLHFVKDTTAHRALWRSSSMLPDRIADATFGMALHLLTALAQRRMVLDLVQRLNVSVVHQPTPVSPRAPSALFDVGAPVVIGPLNGGMTFPPAFRNRQPRFERPIVAALRKFSTAANMLLPGKPRAAAILVANDRTRRALPDGLAGVPVLNLAENGVDLHRWRSTMESRQNVAGPTHFAFVGRLVEWKAVDLLLEAFAQAKSVVDIRLEVFGDGQERAALETLSAKLGLDGLVTFHGFIPQAELPARMAATDVLVLPSLYECGGAVVLEAMAMGLPVLATDWGGPADYLDPSCGVLVSPTSRPEFLDGLRDNMIELARSPDRRHALGAAAREKVRAEFDWERKIDRILEVYSEAIESFRRPTDAPLSNPSPPGTSARTTTGPRSSA